MNDPQNGTSAEPRDAAWVRALPLLVGGLVIFAGLKACGLVGGGSGGLVEGTYRCFTGTLTQSIRQPRTRDELQDQTGQSAVRDVVPPTMMLIPAVFGNIEIESGGNYSLPSMGSGGEYSVSGDELSFTGDLGGMEVRSFEPANGRFTLAYQDMGYQCSLDR
jgi:hypothetical protein